MYAFKCPWTHNPTMNTYSCVILQYCLLYKANDWLEFKCIAMAVQLKNDCFRWNGNAVFFCKAYGKKNTSEVVLFLMENIWMSAHMHVETQRLHNISLTQQMWASWMKICIGCNSCTWDTSWWPKRKRNYVSLQLSEPVNASALSFFLLTYKERDRADPHCQVTIKRSRFPFINKTK